MSSNFQRQPPLSPRQESQGGSISQGSSRKPSIVELLSYPPPLPNQSDDTETIGSSRRPSAGSQGSSITQIQGSRNSSGTDWSEIPLAVLAEPSKLITIHSGYSVQQAFETLVEHGLTSTPVSLSKTESSDLTNCLTFDYGDLNTYLLLVVNRINASDLGEVGYSTQEITNVINAAKRGEQVPVDFIIRLYPKNDFMRLSELDTLYHATEIFGKGIHRVAIVNAADEVIGILSQRRLIRYIWENARRFSSLEPYLSTSLQDLKIGSSDPVFIYGDQLLIDALYKMFATRISSLAVVDRTKALIGNISVVDVQLVSSTKNSHLLYKSVLHFITYNLSLKGMEEGRDPFPIFHVTEQSSLGRVIAKLVATKCHRLWIVESRNISHHNSISNVGSPSGSISNGSELTPNHTGNLQLNQNSPTATIESITSQWTQSVPTTTPTENLGVPSRLIGVVTLTDILGLFALYKSNKRIDPLSARNIRRRSSTSTTRSSQDSASINSDIFKKAYTPFSGEPKR